MNHKNAISCTTKKANRLKIFNTTQGLLHKTKEKNDFFF